MAVNKFLAFDPLQLKEFGFEFMNDGFDMRYQNHQIFFLNRFYIPYGPIIKDKQEFNAFIQWLRSLKTSIIKIDLPLIYQIDFKEVLLKELSQIGFKQVEYLQDHETILISPLNARFDSKDIRYYIRKAEPFYTFEVLSNPSDEEIKQIYNVYIEASKIQNYIPKDISIFNAMSENSIIGIARNKNTNLIDGFVWGYKYEIYTDLNMNTTLNFVDTVFIGTNQSGRDSFAGYGMHKVLFDYLFSNNIADIINFKGAARGKDRKYLSFKKSFGGDFFPLGGSFKCLKTF